MNSNSNAQQRPELYRYFTQDDPDCQVDYSSPLMDRSKGGRIMPWAEQRQAGDILSMLYDQYRPDKANRLRTCAPRLMFQETEDGRLKLHTAWFCRVRLCPVCQWRRSLKTYGQMAEIIKALDAERAAAGRKPYAWVFLTVTVRNVDGLDLPAALDQMTAAWHRLIKRKRFAAAVKGWQRAVEVTYNHDVASDWYDTYHPHYHALLCVNPSYFSDRSYIPYDEWRALWRSAAKLDYDPQVWVTRINPARSGSMQGALAEVAKYATKPSDYLLPDDLDASLAAVKTLDYALDHRRLLAWGGILKDTRQRLQLDDPDDGDLIHTDNEPEPEVVRTEDLIRYSWSASHRGYYKEVDSQCPPDTQALNPPMTQP